MKRATTTITIYKDNLDLIEKVKKEHNLKNTQDLFNLLIGNFLYKNESLPIIKEERKEYWNFINSFFLSKSVYSEFKELINLKQSNPIKNTLKYYAPMCSKELIRTMKYALLRQADGYNIEEYNNKVGNALSLLFICLSSSDKPGAGDDRWATSCLYQIFRSVLTKNNKIDFDYIKELFISAEENYQKNLEILNFNHKKL